MIIVRLEGGLGNQLFQYATGRALAIRHRVPLGLDTADFARDPQRTFRLDHFHHAGLLVSRRVSVCLTEPNLERIASALPFLLRHGVYPARHEVIREDGMPVNEAVLRAGRNACLIGYWQSEKYFADIAPALRRELVVRHIPDAANQALAERIRASASVSVHVRRGDYVSNPHTNAYHGVCTLDYYRAAAQAIAGQVARPHFFVFSDDMAWTRENLRLDAPVDYVAINGPDREYEDLRLMSQCRHHIIANSSFSWWGAWLAQAEDKVVIAPAHWFAGASLDTRDLLPAAWQRI